MIPLPTWILSGLILSAASLLFLLGTLFIQRKYRELNETRREVLRMIDFAVCELRKKNMDPLADIFENSRRSYLRADPVKKDVPRD